MNTKMLKYITTVAEERSISAAAKKLYISQPALSQSIIALEKRLGVLLFDRCTFPLKLTYAGEIFVEAANRILNIERETEIRLDELTNNKTGRIIVGLSLFRNSTIIPQIMPQFKMKYPRVKIELIETPNSPTFDMIINGKVDMAFVTNTTNLELNYVKLLSDRVLLALGKDHPLSRNYAYTDDYPVIELDQLRNETFTMQRQGSKLYALTNEIFKDNNFTPATIIETTSIDLANRMAAVNASFSFIFESIKFLFLPEQQVNYFRFPNKDYQVNLYICYRKNYPMPQYMLDFIYITQQQLNRQKTLPI